MALVKQITVLFIAVLLLVKQNASASPTAAENLIKSSDEVIKQILSSDSKTLEQKEHALARLFEKTVDVEWISKFSLGRHWNQVTKEQQLQYTRLNRALLFQQYLPEVKGSWEQNVVFRNTLDLGEDRYSVNVAFVDEKTPDAEVSYKVHQISSSSYKIYDIVYEGFSLINNQRLEFSSVLNRRGIDYLIYKLGVRTVSSQKYLSSMKF